METINIQTNDIQPFPEQYEVYGEANIDAEFQASIDEFGVITPIIVANTVELGLDGAKYTLISGFRRWTAVKDSPNCDSIPAIIRSYDGKTTDENYDTATVEFLVSNFQREKTERVRIKEFLTLKQKLCHFTKARKDRRNWGSTIFEDNNISRILRMLNPEEFSDVQINSSEILKEVTGYSRYEQQYMTILYDPDWLQNKLDVLDDLGISTKGHNELVDLHEKAVAEYEAENCTMHQAVTEIKRIFKEAEAALRKKLEKKETKGNKEKKELPKVQPKRLKLELNSDCLHELKGDDWTEKYSQYGYIEQNTEDGYERVAICEYSGIGTGAMFFFGDKKVFIKTSDLLSLIREAV